MRPIHERRKLVEMEGHIHAVNRGKRGRIHLENIDCLMKLFKTAVRMLRIDDRGRQNVFDIQIEKIEFEFTNLPKSFDGIRFLLITDTHIDMFDKLENILISKAESLDYDYCILGGDYNFHYRQESGLSFLRMQNITRKLLKKTPVYAVLGNHDRYRIAQTLDECGVQMLINENTSIEKNDERLYLVGLDDCHYYGSADLNLADTGIENAAFKIMICHSPELYKYAAKLGYSLYLAGHTHGGQVCLPNGYAPITNASVPRSMIKGKWQYDSMQGYTSRGAGASGVGVRFNCPPEITIITLKRKEE